MLDKWFYYWRRWIKEGIFKACGCTVRNPEFGDCRITYLRLIRLKSLVRIPAPEDLNDTYCDKVYHHLVNTKKTPTMPGSYESKSTLASRKNRILVPEWMLQRHRRSLQIRGISEESEEDQAGTSSGTKQRRSHAYSFPPTTSLIGDERRAERALESGLSTLDIGSKCSKHREKPRSF